MNHLTQITQPDGTKTSFAYDTRGRRIGVTDANGKTTAYGYDDADRLLSVTDAAGNLTAYGYDTENHLQAITDAANHVTNFAYDPLGRVTQVTFPSTLKESYTYDAVGNLLTKTDRKGQKITYSYDNLYRLSTKTYPDSTAVNYNYDALSRLTQAVDATGTYSFGYDNLGRLTGTTTNYAFLSSRTLTEGYAYDAASNRTSFTDAEGGVTNYAYDSLNRMTGLTDFNSNPFGFSYDALGRRTNLTRPNGVSTSYAYDSLSRLLSILHQSSAFTGGTGYAYDAVGNRVSRTDTFQPAGGALTQTATNYSYDSIYELTQAVVNGTPAESYTYDAVGNRLSSLGIPSYSYNSSNELTSASPATFTYDANGNTLTKTAPNGTTSYTWDFENRLTSVTVPKGTVLHYQYDPFGRRIFSDGTGRIFVYDGDNVIEDLDLNGKSVARYTQGLGIDEPLEETASGASSYYEADGLGSVSSLTNASGSIANTYGYDSFGNQTASTGSVSNRFFFTARENVAKTGLLYYRARYYDPTVGRFLSEDPIGFSAGVDFYPYVQQNPTNLSDPYGLQGAVPSPVTTPGAQPPLNIPPPRTAPSPGSTTSVFDAVVNDGLVGAAEVFGAFVAIVANPETMGPSEQKNIDKMNEECQKKKGKWHCRAKCHINNFSDLPNIPDFVFGEGWGNSQPLAELAAEKDANTKVPRGTYKRHCSFKCEQR